MFVGEGIFGAVLLAYAPYRRQFIALLRQNTGAVLAINATNELINLGGGLGNRYALKATRGNRQRSCFRKVRTGVAG
jgi:hypothetical protein